MHCHRGYSIPEVRYVSNQLSINSYARKNDDFIDTFGKSTEGINRRLKQAQLNADKKVKGYKEQMQTVDSLEFENLKELDETKESLNKKLGKKLKDWKNSKPNSKKAKISIKKLKISMNKFQYKIILSNYEDF